MTTRAPEILALDFDGVICNGLVEYFRTTCRTYCQIWCEDSQHPTQGLAASFYKLRPVIETGWEMPILLRALIIGIPEQKILDHWGEIAQQITAEEHLEQKDIARKLDAVRDHWIKKDLQGWLALHEFYPGVVERIQSILTEGKTQLVIITTKEGRFVKQLLQQQGINLPDDSIIGKESQRPKYETLRILMQIHSSKKPRVWFVEDRLKTLQSVHQQSDLERVQLYLADWGYNTASAQAIADQHSKLKLLSLQQFSQDFTAWKKKK